MTLRTVWSRKPAFAIEDPSAVPANGLAAQVATHPEWAGGGEALPAAGGIAAAPASSVAPPITAARRQAARLIDMTAFNSLTSFLVPPPRPVAVWLPLTLGPIRHGLASLLVRPAARYLAA